VYGPIVIVPRGGYAQAFDRDFVVMLSDWTDESPNTIISNLKFRSNYHNYAQRTLGTFLEDTQREGLTQTVADRIEWGRMRMSPTDIPVFSGATYTYLINGQPLRANWTAV
jgi:FtsP/CotA-like multicopper oxidase with cupredoxin domain